MNDSLYPLHDYRHGCHLLYTLTSVNTSTISLIYMNLKIYTNCPCCYSTCEVLQIIRIKKNVHVQNDLGIHTQTYHTPDMFYTL